MPITRNIIQAKDDGTWSIKDYPFIALEDELDSWYVYKWDVDSNGRSVPVWKQTITPLVTVPLIPMVLSTAHPTTVSASIADVMISYHRFIDEMYPNSKVLQNIYLGPTAYIKDRPEDENVLVDVNKELHSISIGDFIKASNDSEVYEAVIYCIGCLAKKV